MLNRHIRASFQDIFRIFAVSFHNGVADIDRKRIRLFRLENFNNFQ